MTAQHSVQEILAMIKNAQATPMNDPALAGLLALEKSSTFSQGNSPTSGLTFYNLEAGAKFLYPVLTPLRNMIPRVSSPGGIQASWRAVTGVNTSGMRIGVSGGNRGGVQAVATADYTAAYKGIGIEGSVDFEAQYAAGGFADVYAIGAKTTLEACMLGEEAMIVGGNTSVALGTTPTPTVSAADTGGALTVGTWSVICVALAYDGLVNGSVAGGIQGQITRTNAGPYSSSDVFGGGAGRKSAAATGAVGAVTTGKLTATVTPVTGALGYAWFWGMAGSEVLGAITTINSAIILAAATGTQTAASLGTGDNSTNSLAFDGLLTQALKSGSGAYVVSQATGTAGTGTALTADGAGGVTEIEAALKSMWDTSRLSPDTIWVNSQEAKNLSTKILAGSANSSFRFVVNADKNNLGGGIMVRNYSNKFSMAGANSLDIKIHPNMPAGTLLMTTGALPYPISGVGNIIQIRTRQDYYQIQWPLVTRKQEFGVYADEVLQNYFPASMCVITNIGNG